jgi:excinuclease ABC subunit A
MSLKKLGEMVSVRLRVDGEVVELADAKSIRLEKTKVHFIEAVVDRLSVRPDLGQRLADTVETALRLGNGQAFHKPLGAGRLKMD